MAEAQLTTDEKLKGLKPLDLLKILAFNSDDSAEDLRERIVMEAVAMDNAEPRWRFLTDCLSRQIKVNLIPRLLTGRQPDANDWRNLFHPVTYTANGSWHHRIMCIMGFICGIIGGVEFLRVCWRSSESILSWPNLGIIGFCLYAVGMFYGAVKDSGMVGILGGPVVCFHVCLGYLFDLKGFEDTSSLTKPYLILIIIIVMLPSLILSYYLTLFFLRYFTEIQTGLIWALIYISFYSVMEISDRKERAAQNILHGILDSQLRLSSQPSQYGMFQRLLLLLTKRK